MWRMMIIMVVLVSSVYASTEAQAIKNRLDKELRKLEKVRANAFKKNIKLSKQVEALQEKIIQKDGKLVQLQAVLDSKTISLKDLQQEVTSFKSDTHYLQNMLKAFKNYFSKNIYDKTRFSYVVDIDFSKDDEIANIKEALSLVDDAFDKAYEGFELRTFDTQVSTIKEGSIIEGTMLVMGPLVGFVSKDTAQDNDLQQGIIFDANKQIGALFPLDADNLIGYQNILANQSTMVPIDITLGKIKILDMHKESLWQHLKSGRIWGFVIITLALVALVCMVLKSLQLYRVKILRPQDFAHYVSILDSNDDNKEDIRAIKNSYVRDIIVAIKDELQNGKVSKERIEDILYEKSLQYKVKLERFLFILSLSAAVSPLLGLLGTVTGMIKTFKLITIFGTGDSKALSGGISEALVTTELGLIVAIPSLIAFVFLQKRVQKFLLSVESFGLYYLNGKADVKD